MGFIREYHSTHTVSLPEVRPGGRPWVIDDTRRRCTLVLGDGFTQSLLTHVGLVDSAPSIVKKHFPAPDDKLYHPTTGDTFGSAPARFWDPHKWPLLSRAWSDFGSTNAWEFYRSLSHERINASLPGGWAFDTASLGYQLRAYLWHYFVSLDAEVMAESRAGKLHDVGTTWPWAILVQLLDLDFRLSVISFNYDMFFERLFKGLIRGQLVGTVENNLMPLEQNSLGSVILLKPHGGINQFLTKPARYVRASANPWLDDISVLNDASNAALTQFHEPLVAPFDFFPLTPSIVPPGHLGDNICNPFSQVPALGCELVNSAHIVIFCGLSARDPDTKEVAKLVSSIKQNALVVHVGRSAHMDHENDLARLIGGSCVVNRHFIDAKDIASVGKLIGTRFKISRALWEPWLT